MGIVLEPYCSAPNTVSNGPIIENSIIYNTVEILLLPEAGGSGWMQAGQIGVKSGTVLRRVFT